MFEIYNLASIIQNDGPPNLEGMEKRIEALASDISNNFPNTLKSKRMRPDTGEGGNKPPTKKNCTGQGANIGLGIQCDEDVYQDGQVVDLFTRAGYTLESNDEDEKGWAPLIQVKQRSTLSVDLN